MGCYTLPGPNEKEPGSPPPPGNSMGQGGIPAGSGFAGARGAVKSLPRRALKPPP
jgi:hypothetical protein